MLDQDATTFLKSLLDAPGPSGFETRPSRLWRERASTFSTVSKDVAGNSFATVNEKGTPTILLAGHIDEIGVITQYIDDDGFVSIQPIGGWDPEVFVGQRIRFLTHDGDVYGVIGKRPIHLLKAEDRLQASKITDLWVDIGAANRAEAETRLSVGDPGVIDARAMDFPNNRLASRAIDNRIGSFVVLEAARRYAAQPGSAKVVATATTQEEIAYRGGGARISAAISRPQVAIVVDLTFATDHPKLEKKEIGDHPLGGGPVLARGALVSPVIFGLLQTSAERLKIKVRVQAAGRDTGTDADAIHLMHEGVATALVSIPNRYMHSPNEMVSLDDVDAAAELLAEACRQLTAATDLTAR